MTTVLVLHHYNGCTKTAVFTAPVVSRQMIDGGIHATLHEAQGGPVVGDAMFASGGIVLLSGWAMEQYGPITKPGIEEKGNG